LASSCRTSIDRRAPSPAVAFQYPLELCALDAQSTGAIPLDPYASVRSWIERIKALPGFVGMPGI
jgi:hypothetical protein